VLRDGAGSIAGADYPVVAATMFMAESVGTSCASRN
jgi:hypothetical protein